MNQLHPIFAQALRPWTPPPSLPREPQDIQDLRDKLWDEYDTGLDDVEDRYTRNEEGAQ